MISKLGLIYCIGFELIIYKPLEFFTWCLTSFTLVNFHAELFYSMSKRSHLKLNNFMFAHYVLNSCAHSSLSDQMLGIHISYICILYENRFHESPTLSNYWVFGCSIHILLSSHPSQYQVFGHCVWRIFVVRFLEFCVFGFSYFGFEFLEFAVCIFRF